MRTWHPTRTARGFIHLQLLGTILNHSLLLAEPVRETVEGPALLHRSLQLLLLLMPFFTASTFSLPGLREQGGFRVTGDLPFEELFQRNPATGLGHIPLCRHPRLRVEGLAGGFSILKILASVKQVHAQQVFHLCTIASYRIEFHAVLFISASKS